MERGIIYHKRSLHRNKPTQGDHYEQNLAFGPVVLHMRTQRLYATRKPFWSLRPISHCLLRRAVLAMENMDILGGQQAQTPQTAPRCLKNTKRATRRGKQSLRRAGNQSHTAQFHHCDMSDTLAFLWNFRLCQSIAFETPRVFCQVSQIPDQNTD